MDEEEIELFVPGRLCLFGEHSDWAGGHRRQNPAIEKGYTIVAPTNQGNYARVKKIDEPIFRFKSSLSDEKMEVRLEPQALLKIAEEGGLFSYVAGVVHEIICSYHGFMEQGIEIDNYKTDLPTKKGISSSASICVLVAKAFNEIYNLGFTNKRIMELAYFGEITTPSRCGKMDQACAYDKPILMTFDGDKLNVEELKLEKEINILVVDLNRGKDTVKILADLNEGFPWPNSEVERSIHQYLGKMNKSIVISAKKALEKGDAVKVGCMMELAQNFFDEYLIPASGELEAPTLHSVLGMQEIKEFIYGGKCVGSGGDGSAQLICKSIRVREKVKEILTMKGFNCFDLDLKSSIEPPNNKITAVIPAGGFGLRLYPLTENQPKSLLEIQGKPLIDYTIDKINEIENIDKIIITTNNKFYEKFKEWGKEKGEKIKIINNGVNNEQEALSGFGDLMLAINNEKVEGDILVLGGDNLFDCSLKEIYKIFRGEEKDLAVCYDVMNIEKAKSLGVAEIKDNLIRNFKEKPENPKSTICSTSAYFYKKETLQLIKEFAEKHPRGHLGTILEYLFQRVPIYAYIIKDKWIDINDKTALKLADSITYRDLSF